MNDTDLLQARRPADDFGRRIAARLTVANDELPYEVTERLRAARVQALARRKRVQARPAAAVLSRGGGTAALGAGSGLGFWGRLASMLPIAVLAFGLILIHVEQREMLVQEIAQIDAALLTDDLPPEAYADPAFVHYLHTSAE